MEDGPEVKDGALDGVKDAFELFFFEVSVWSSTIVARLSDVDGDAPATRAPLLPLITTAQNAARGNPFSIRTIVSCRQMLMAINIYS